MINLTGVELSTIEGAAQKESISPAGAGLLSGLGGYLERGASCGELICVAVCVSQYNALLVRFYVLG